VLISDFEDRIKRHEGFRSRVYSDSLGIPTIGYGHNLRTGLPQEILEIIFQLDLKQAYEDFIFRFPDKYKRHLNDVRKSVIIELIFNMGLKSLMAFKNMLSALERGDFETASKELLDSKYAKQVGERCAVLAKLLRSGREEDHV